MKTCSLSPKSYSSTAYAVNPAEQAHRSAQTLREVRSNDLPAARVNAVNWIPFESGVGAMFCGSFEGGIGGGTMGFLADDPGYLKAIPKGRSEVRE